MKKTKKLGKNMYSKNQFKYTLLYIIVFFLLIFFTDFLVEIHEAFLLLYIAVLIFFIIKVNKINPLLSCQKEFQKDLKVFKLVNNLNKILEENLHPESENIVKLYKANFLAFINIDAASNLFKEVEIPKGRYYQNFYYTVEICQKINSKDFSEAIRLIDIYRKRVKKEKIMEREMKIIEFNLYNKEIENVDIYFNVKTKSRIVNLINARFLINYYKDKDLNKAKEYAKMILTSNTDIPEYLKTANEIVNG